MNIKILLFAVFLCSHVVLAAAQEPDAQLDDEQRDWVIVLEDPRPARLQGWQRSQYSGSKYEQALELKRFGQRVARKHGLSISAEWFIESLGVYCLIATFNGEEQKTLKKLRADKKVRWVQPSNEFELLQSPQSVPVDLSGFGAPESELPLSMDGAGVVIAMIDSGVDEDHPELLGRLDHNQDYVENHNKPFAGEPHGTAIASVIIAPRVNGSGVTGIAPMSSLRAYRGCWESVSEQLNCNTLSLARALDAAVRDDIDVLNLSLSGPRDDLLQELVNRAIDEGAIVVAAHDPRRPAEDRFPLNSPRTVIVANSVGHKPASASSISAPFAAPGQKLVAAPDAKVTIVRGHSVATAYTSASLALCLQLEMQRQREICSTKLSRGGLLSLQQLYDLMQRAMRQTV